MNAIAFVVSLIIYVMVFNVIILIPGALVLLLIQAGITALIGKNLATLIIAIPFFALCGLSVFLAYRSAQNNAFYNHGFRKSASLAISEAKALILASLPLRAK